MNSKNQPPSPESPVQRIVRRGWRAFECQECSTKWEWPSRDRFSPSGENCPNCGDWEFPCGSRADDDIPVDEYGNLTCAWNMTPPNARCASYCPHYLTSTPTRSRLGAVTPAAACSPLNLTPKSPRWPRVLPLTVLRTWLCLPAFLRRVVLLVLSW